MLSPLSLAALGLFVQSSYAISWALIFDNGNTWVEQTFTVNVPPPPPPEVTTGPWYFWCGLQPQGGGVIQPVLGWKASESQVVNPYTTFPQVWAMNLWSLPWNYGSQNNYQLQESSGIWVDQNAQIASDIRWENGQWYQQANVISGAAAGQTIELTTPASYFQSDTTGDDNTPMALCESELDGAQTGDWDFTVTFTDVYFKAKTSDGLQAMCESATDHSDGDGFISFSGFTMVDDETCYWSSITLSPA